jgi:glycosyltransferase involved in cell wall biosynthesis
MNKTLFIGKSSSASCWYRCALPAANLGQDWIGIAGGPPGEGFVKTGNVIDWPLTQRHENVVVQYPYGDDWKNWIKAQQDLLDVKVYYEIDDFIHGIKKIPEHKFQKSYNKKIVKEHEELMQLCDGIICSTEFLAEQYSKYNETHVCEVGIDTDRYDVPIPDHEGWINIGWAGGDGHHKAIGPWLEVVSDIMTAFKNVRFISIGVPYGSAINQRHKGRGISIPWLSVENLPYALTNFDISLAPAHDSKYHRSKSLLRWIESAAVGIPVIADPLLYAPANCHKPDNLEKFENTLIELIMNENSRKQAIEFNKGYVQEYYDISQKVEQWKKVLDNG